MNERSHVNSVSNNYGVRISLEMDPIPIEWVFSHEVISCVAFSHTLNFSTH